jgi:hypothetical protein
MLQTLTIQPPLLSDFNPGLGVELARVVARALAKQPDDRYDNLETMRIALCCAAAVVERPLLDQSFAPAESTQEASGRQAGPG